MSLWYSEQNTYLETKLLPCLIELVWKLYETTNHDIFRFMHLTTWGHAKRENMNAAGNESWQMVTPTSICHFIRDGMLQPTNHRGTELSSSCCVLQETFTITTHLFALMKEFPRCTNTRKLPPLHSSAEGRRVNAHFRRKYGTSPSLVGISFTTELRCIPCQQQGS